MGSKEFLESFMRALSLEFKDYSDFLNKYGAVTSGNPIPLAIGMLWVYLEGIGVLLNRKLIDIGW